jgi:outer membrane lipoprotein-sorting protein
MRFALLVALLPALAGGGNEAEKLFREVEKKLTSAKSLHVASEMAVQERDKDLKFIGSVDLAGKNVRLQLSGNVDGKDMKLEVVSDGKKLVSVTPFGNKDESPPKNLSDLVSKMVSRVGVAGSMFVIRRGAAGKDEGPLDPDKLFRVHDFKMGEAEKVNGRDTKVLRYQLEVSEEKKEKAEVTLWVDAKTLLPLKRLVVAGEGKARITETYTEFKLNPKLDAKTFELPK